MQHVKEVFHFKIILKQKKNGLGENILFSLMLLGANAKKLDFPYHIKLQAHGQIYLKT